MKDVGMIILRAETIDWVVSDGWALRVGNAQNRLFVIKEMSKGEQALRLRELNRDYLPC
jgi:hypothetical protein